MNSKQRSGAFNIVRCSLIDQLIQQFSTFEKTSSVLILQWSPSLGGPIFGRGLDTGDWERL